MEFIKEEPKIKKKQQPKMQLEDLQLTLQMIYHAEHLITYRDCARKYEISRIRIINHCISVFDLLSKMICLHFQANQNCTNLLPKTCAALRRFAVLRQFFRRQQSCKTKMKQSDEMENKIKYT